MKHIIWKPYWNYEKEEAWLNEMAAKGLALTDYSWCRYVFEECPRGEYTYRIELLDNWPTHPESMAYIRFVEETGVECVATYMRWVYFRKKSADGPFDIYSDIDSRIAHYKRVNTFWSVFAGLEFAIGIMNVTTGIGAASALNLGLGLFLVALGCSFLALGSPLRKKIKKLKQEKAIRE